ncbi:MAG TPA: YwbE family protein [Cyanobacteria bacterium UBA8530]|nr:YwbE family protein [Cyanobacteria bacterium UBA8530]
MTGQERQQISAGLEVGIVLKADQRTGHITRGIVADILTKSPFHPHGIKVRLTDGQVGRVKEIYGRAG